MNELYRDGTVAGEGGYLGPNKHGEWTYYHRNGQLKAHGRYEDGELAGGWVWYRENGNLLQRGSFLDGTAARPLGALRRGRLPAGRAPLRPRAQDRACPA